MEPMEIILLIVGVVIFVLSFFIPDKGDKNAGVSKEVTVEEIKKMVEKEMGAIRGQVDDVVEEAITYSMEKTERSLERLSNEKIMAVSEYSDTVLAEIHKNHEEAMFLYDMLNSKHINLKDTVSEVNRTVKEAEDAVSDIKKVMPEPKQESVQDSTVKQERRKPETREQESKKSEVKMPKKEKLPDEGETALDVSMPFEPLKVEMPGQNNNEKILELYRQGKSTVAIAKELGLGVGEVKLVIGLYKNQ